MPSHKICEIEIKFTPHISLKNSHWVILTWVFKWLKMAKANQYCFLKWCDIEVVK